MALVCHDVPDNASVLFVAYVDGRPSGVGFVDRSGAKGMRVDGAEVGLDRTFSGQHTVEVVAWSDEDADGSFDPNVDRPCTQDGEIVRAGPKRINFTGPGTDNSDLSVRISDR